LLKVEWVKRDNMLAVRLSDEEAERRRDGIQDRASDQKMERWRNGGQYRWARGESNGDVDSKCAKEFQLQKRQKREKTIGPY
jgi:hypothetical protein